MPEPVTSRIGWLHYLREREVENALRLVQLPKGARVLDFGAGDGFIAAKFAERGFEVTAVDLFPRHPQFYPVQPIEENVLPFDDGSFDLIFASNVLEHVRDLPAVFQELKRVLAPDGSCLFTMPTPAWRFWSLANLPLKLFTRRGGDEMYVRATGRDSNEAETARAQKKGSLPARAVRYLLQPHGESPNALYELFSFSPRRWRREFAENDFEVVAARPEGILYTGSVLFPGRAIRLRELLSAFAMSSCMIYHVRPTQRAEVRQADRWPVVAG